jgi:hypothetical protein
MIHPLDFIDELGFLRHGVGKVKGLRGAV